MDDTYWQYKCDEVVVFLLKLYKSLHEQLGNIYSCLFIHVMKWQCTCIIIQATKKPA